MKKYILQCTHFLLLTVAIHGMERGELYVSSSSDEETIIPVNTLSADNPLQRSVSAPIPSNSTFNLDLQGISSSAPQKKTSGANSAKTPRTPISNFQDLSQQVQRAKSVRIASPAIVNRSGAQRGLTGKTIQKKSTTEVGDIPKEKIQKIEETLGFKIIGGKKYYSEDDVWSKVEKLNPSLYDIAQRDQMTLDEVIEFAEIVESLDIDSEVFRQIAERKSENSNQTKNLSIKERLIQWWYGNPQEDMKKKWKNRANSDADDHKLLLYAAVKAAYDHTEDFNNRSPIADTHIDLQSSHISEQAATIRQQYIALAISTLLSIGGWGFGIIGQFVNPSNCTH